MKLKLHLPKGLKAQFISHPILGEDSFVDGHEFDVPDETDLEGLRQQMHGIRLERLEVEPEGEGARGPIGEAGVDGVDGADGTDGAPADGYGQTDPMAGTDTGTGGETA